MTDYSEKIEKKFKTHGFKPREKQVSIINEILNLYIDEKNKYVILSASTGIGKSLIALVVSELLHELTGEPNKNNRKKSYIVAHTNTLLEQYSNSYKDSFETLIVKGRGNYDCRLMDSTAEDCIVGRFNSNAKIKPKCQSCDFLKMKRMMDKTDHVCTNYSYIFNANFYSEQMAERLLTVYDEGHLMNDIFVDFMKIQINIKDLKLFIFEIDKEHDSMFDNANDIFEDLITGLENGNINEDNYIDVLNDALEAYIIAYDAFTELANREYAQKNFPAFSMYKRQSKKYQHRLSRIQSFFELEYEHVVDVKDADITISTIFMLDLFKSVENSQYSLFMSATIDVDYITTTLGVEADSVGFINGGGIFDPENKTAINCQMSGFNYTKLQDEKFVDDVCEYMNKIVGEYDDEKGIILVTSFKQLMDVKKRLVKYVKKKKLDIKIFHQTREKGLNVILKEFVEYDEPSVLISPSLFEGISLDDDLCRYIIFFKAPYYSLGDKRIKYILNKYPAIYEKLAVYRMIQGSGRAVRNTDDWCDTYFLDGNLMKLFKSKHNLWKNEFKQYKRKAMN